MHDSTLWDLEAPVARVSRARPSSQGPVALGAVTGDKRSAPLGWTHLTVRDGKKGPVEIEMVTRRVQTRLERKRTGPDEWLVVTLVVPSQTTGLMEPCSSTCEIRGGIRYQ